MNELLAQFIAEARDLLQEAGEDLLALERAPGDEPAINRLFRSVHTLKGSSGLFDAAPMTQVLHAAEDIFQAVREHGLALTPEMVDLTLKALDQVGRWIEQLDRHDALPGDAAAGSKALVTELRRTFGRRPGEPLAAPVETAAADATVAPPEVLRWFSRQGLAVASEAATRSGRIHLVSYSPPEDCFFRGEDPLHLALQIPQLLAFGIEARAPWLAWATSIRSAARSGSTPSPWRNAPRSRRCSATFLTRSPSSVSRQRRCAARPSPTPFLPIRGDGRSN